MLSDLKDEGFHVSCWQLPYFVPKNKLFPELVEKNLVVRDAQGQSALRGRGAGFFQSGNGGLVSGQTGEPVENGRQRDQGGFWRSRAGERTLRRRPHRILRAQSVSAALQQGRRGHHQEDHRRKHHLGAQRVGGQPALSACTGAATRRAPTTAWRRNCAAGLSFGLSGFSFWSHDVGGFTANSVADMDKDLFARWLAFGMLSSHSRCHGDRAEGTVELRRRASWTSSARLTS